MPSDNRRLALVEQLLQFALPLDVLSTSLRTYDRDYEGEAVDLTPAHIVSVLERLIKRELTSRDVEAWANLIELREDIHFEVDSPLGEVAHELANPTLYSPLTDERAHQIRAALAE